LLLEHGAKVNAKDKEGHTPLFSCHSVEESSDLADLLRKHDGCRPPGPDRQPAIFGPGRPPDLAWNSQNALRPGIISGGSYCNR
jgi:hypothetical protein